MEVQESYNEFVIDESYFRERYSFRDAREILCVTPYMLKKWLSISRSREFPASSYSDSSNKKVVTYNDFLECKFLANVREASRSPSHFNRILERFREVHDTNETDTYIPFYLLFRYHKILKSADDIITSISLKEKDYSQAINYNNMSHFFEFMVEEFNGVKLTEIYKGIYYDTEPDNVRVKPLDDICPDISVNPKYNFGAPSIDGTRIASSHVYDSYIFFRCKTTPLFDSINDVPRKQSKNFYGEALDKLKQKLVFYVEREHSYERKHILDCVIFEDLIRHRKHYNL